MPAKTLGSVVQQGKGSHVSLSETEKKPHESFATLTASWVELEDQCQSAAVQEESLNVFLCGSNGCCEVMLSLATE